MDTQGESQTSQVTDDGLHSEKIITSKCLYTHP